MPIRVFLSILYTNFNFPHVLLDIIFHGGSWKSLKWSLMSVFRSSVLFLKISHIGTLWALSITVVKSVGSWAKLPELTCLLGHFLAVWPESSGLTSLCSSPLICKMVITAHILQDCHVVYIHVKLLQQSMTHREHPIYISYLLWC